MEPASIKEYCGAFSTIRTNRHEGGRWRPLCCDLAGFSREDSIPDDTDALNVLASSRRGRSQVIALILLDIALDLGSGATAF